MTIDEDEFHPFVQFYAGTMHQEGRDDHVYIEVSVDGIAWNSISQDGVRDAQGHAFLVETNDGKHILMLKENHSCGGWMGPVNGIDQGITDYSSKLPVWPTEVRWEPNVQSTSTAN